MELSTRDILTKKILDSQEMVRDYEVFSKKVEDTEIADLFKGYAEECGFQAANLLKILNNRYSKE